MDSFKKRKGFRAEGAEGSSSSQHSSPLAKLDERGAAEPLDDEEQSKIIKELSELNEKSNYIYRSALLFMLSLVIVVYITPIPAYLAGTHPENHLTLLYKKHHHTPTHDDILYLPAAPIYLFLFSIQATLLAAVAYETAERLGLVHLPALPFPQQPHRFGTAPGWLAPVLEDIRLQPTEEQRKKEEKGDRAATRVGGRLVYLIFLTVVSTPIPLMTFGAGSFTNAGWWALTPLVLIATSTVEWWMSKVTAETQGLASMKYPYRGA
ncbi:hypothetical protein V8E36_003786 [Tilletia maclaganii]